MNSDNFLTRPEIDGILDAMTARDIFNGMPSGTDPGAVKGGDIAAKVFESAASRQGFGDGTLDRVRPADGTYLARRLGEIFNEGPKDDSTEPLPLSSDIGESTPS